MNRSEDGSRQPGCLIEDEEPRGGGLMGYQKINVELVVFSEEADAMVAELNSAIDRLEKTYTIFGGGIENVQ